MAKTPTQAEIEAIWSNYKQSTYKQLEEQRFFYDQTNRVISKRTTVPLMRHSDPTRRNEMWKICKKVEGFWHYPTSYKEVIRVSEFGKDELLMRNLLDAMHEMGYPFVDFNQLASINTDSKEYSHLIAILAQSQFYRDEIIAWFKEIRTVILENNPNDLVILDRTLTFLFEDYPDLKAVCPPYQK